MTDPNCTDEERALDAMLAYRQYCRTKLGLDPNDFVKSGAIE